MTNDAIPSRTDVVFYRRDDNSDLIGLTTGYSPNFNEDITWFYRYQGGQMIPTWTTIQSTIN